jgi:hypothetical protein
MVVRGGNLGGNLGYDTSHGLVLIPHRGRAVGARNRPTCPVEAATKFQLVTISKTAQTLGITVLPSLLNRAAELIEYGHSVPTRVRDQ